MRGFVGQDEIKKYHDDKVLESTFLKFAAPIAWKESGDHHLSLAKAGRFRRSVPLWAAELGAVRNFDCNLGKFDHILGRFCDIVWHI